MADTSGFAFPLAAGHRTYCGMTLRVYIAIKAMEGELAAQSPEEGYYSTHKSCEYLVKRSVEIADQMLEELAK